MGLFDSLTQSPAPGSATTATATNQTMPDWYTGFLRDMAARGVQIGNKGYQQYGGTRVAGFSPDQQAGFAATRNNVGAWKPGMQAAQGALGQASTQLQGANKNWTDPGVSQSYMSPYMSGVTDEIARLGNQNFSENLMPQVQGAFTGAGQFGSTRNADILGRTARDVQANISGQQTQALQQGYGQAADIFGNDMSRGQQGAQIGAQLAGAQGALGQLASQMGGADAAALGQIGQQQQNQQQAGLDLAYKDFLDQNNFDWQNLERLKGTVSGMQLPTGASTASNAPVGGYGASPLEWLMSIMGQSGGN